MEKPLLEQNQNKTIRKSNYLRALLWKNYIVYKRNKQKLIFLLLGPILVNCAILLCQILADNQQRHIADENPQPKEINPKLPHCYDFMKNHECVSLSYGVTGKHQEWVDFTIQHLQKVNEYKNEEVEEAFSTDSLESKILSPYNQYFKQNPGKVQIAIEFCTGQRLFINTENQIPAYISNCNDLNLQVPPLIDSVYEDGEDEEQLKSYKKQKLKNNYNFVNQYQNLTDFENYYNIYEEDQCIYKSEQNEQKQLDGQQENGMYIQKFDNSLFYILHMNMTQLQKGKFNYNYDSMGIILKNQIDNILANYISQNKPNEISLDSITINSKNNQNTIDKQDQEMKQYIQIETQQFPGIQDTRIMKKFKVASELGAFWFVIIPLYIFYIFLGDLIQEKEKSLRIGMSIYGVPHFKYWLSWIITSIIIALFTTVYTILIAYAFQFEIFLRTPIEMMFLVYFTFIISLISVAFFLSTVFNNQKSALACGIAFILVSFVIEMLISTSIALNLIYQKDADDIFLITQIFFDLFSPFNYTKLYVDFQESSKTIFSNKQNKWIQQDGMTWPNIFKTRQGKVVGKTYERPSSANSYLLLLMNITIFVLLTIYFDNYLDQNRGIGKPWHLNIFRKCQKQKQLKLDESNQKNQEINKIITKISLQEMQSNEKEKKKESEVVQMIEDPILLNEDFDNNKNNQDLNIGIQVNNVSKTFVKKSLLYYCCSKKNKQKKIKITKALKNVNIEIYNNEICGFLGHSGAGKTTLINILTGMIDYNDGDIFINGIQLNQDNMNQLRKNMGFCPQFDVIWNQLTPREHIQFFCKIKGINEQQEIDQIIEQKLQMVSLQKVENGQAGGFSGGMKRRLSLVISTIGDPDVLFLDEPTNAMDPKSKREAWKMIQNCKQDRCVLLTTHSMEEADILSDKIIILSQGQVLCQGRTYDLKQKYGKGNRFYVITKKNTENSIAISKIEQQFDIEIEDFSGNSLIFCIPSKEQQQALFIFLDKMDQDESLSKNEMYIKQVIDDWGFSNATIEDVFLKVTKGHRDTKKSFQSQHFSLINSKIKD